jgi:hypothetical protein
LPERREWYCFQTFPRAELIPLIAIFSLSAFHPVVIQTGIQ